MIHNINRLVILILLAATIGIGQIKAAQNDIILTWSSSSFAPAWYPGKHLPSSGSQITVSASPEILIRGTNLRPQDLTYRWFLDYRLQNAVSGKGQQDFSFTASGSKGAVINVKAEIYNPTGSLLGQKSLKITLAEPTVQIHRLLDNSFRGLAFKNSADLRPSQKISFIAAPYFFNITDTTQLEFRWRANDEPALGAAERPDILHLEIGSEIPVGAVYDLIATIQNNLQKNESALGFLKITIR